MLARLYSQSCKLGFSSRWPKNFQTYKLGLEKAEPDIKLPTFTGLWRKQENSRETSTSVSLTTLKPQTVWITTNCGKFLKRWKYQTTLPVSWETCMWVKKQQLDADMGQLTGSKLGKELQGCVFSPCLLNLYAEYITWNAWLDDSQAGIKIGKKNINNLR